jgi:hypothetical protein
VVPVVYRAADLEIRPEEHLVLARGRALTLALLHTHFGFGYRFSAELAFTPFSQDGDKQITGLRRSPRGWSS